MQKAVVISTWHDSGDSCGGLREIMVCVTVDPDDDKSRSLVLSAVSTIEPPFSAISIDLEELLEVLEELREPAGKPTDLLSHRVAELMRRYESHEATLSHLAIRVGDLEAAVYPRGGTTNA